MPRKKKSPYVEAEEQIADARRLETPINRKEAAMNIPKLALSVLASFAQVLFFAFLLHLIGQNSKQWWLLLLPLWAAGAYAAYRFWPWSWPRDSQPR